MRLTFSEESDETRKPSPSVTQELRGGLGTTTGTGRMINELSGFFACIESRIRNELRLIDPPLIKRPMDAEYVHFIHEFRARPPRMFERRAPAWHVNGHLAVLQMEQSFLGELGQRDGEHGDSEVQELLVRYSAKRLSQDHLGGSMLFQVIHLSGSAITANSYKIAVRNAVSCWTEDIHIVNSQIISSGDTGHLDVVPDGSVEVVIFEVMPANLFSRSQPDRMVARFVHSVHDVLRLVSLKFMALDSSTELTLASLWRPPPIEPPF